MNILVDSSVWIDYFREGRKSELLDFLIDQNLICTNNLILAELIPPLGLRGQNRLIKLLYEITNINLDIDWQKIIQYQTECLKNGINGVGIPDLIILDNVIRNNLTLYSLDKHFQLISSIINFDLIPLL
jgi:predicted nucleic acid-binding protein